MSRRLYSCLAIAAVAVIFTGCSLGPAQKKIVQRTKIEQCPSKPVEDQCNVTPLPKAGQFLRMMDGVRVRNALKMIGVFLDEHKDCQDEVKLWRFAYEQCHKGRR